MTAALSLWRGQVVARTRRDDVRDVIAEVAERHGVSIADLMSTRRTREIAYARFEAWSIMREQMLWSLPKIGRFFGRDHSSILHGVRRWPDIKARFPAKTVEAA